MVQSNSVVLDRVAIDYGSCRPLDDASAVFGAESVAITGPSGSGKSSLLRVIAGIQRPTTGSVQIGATLVHRSSWSHGSDERVAMVFQDHHLVEFLTVEENLELAAECRAAGYEREAAVDRLQDVGLGPEYLARKPETLSGGEQQRVAIARALLTRSSVLLADEPTGALDEDNSRIVASILKNIGAGGDVTVIVATHDPLVAEVMDRRMALHRGVLE